MKTLQDKIDAIIERQHSMSDVKLLIAIDSNEINKAIQELRDEIDKEITDCSCDGCKAGLNTRHNNKQNRIKKIVLALIGEKK